MKTRQLHVIGLLLITCCPPTCAEIYKWVDDKGKVHFSDSPHEEAKVETLDIEPAVKIGTVKPPSADHLFKADFSKSQQKQQQRENQAEKRRKKKAALRKACDDAKADLAKAIANRAGASSNSSKRYYNEKIELAKDREDQACKLSNFR
ncbi:hypothetical protein imdm_341 [gamma proteobacterium IMCC2047]|nr:hypothetical protein imdm_341 [gamma proteobacterium IMCC2047]